MRLLLDTHIILWQLSGERSLPAAVADAIANATEIRVSVLSFAEIGIKVSVGKLEVPIDLWDRVSGAGVRALQLTPQHGLAVTDLPMHHRDPVDRLIIAQAMLEGLTVVTADRRFLDYEIEVLDASMSDPH